MRTFGRAAVIRCECEPTRSIPAKQSLAVVSKNDSSADGVDGVCTQPSRNAA